MIWQNSQKNTYAGVSFLIRLQEKKEKKRKAKAFQEVSYMFHSIQALHFWQSSAIL